MRLGRKVAIVEQPHPGGQIVYVSSRGMSFSRPVYTVRRREPRYVSARKISVTRFLRFGPVVTRGMSLEVSRLGMLVLVCGAPRVGETVIITPRVADDPVEILATVRHSADAGSGFEFYPLSPAAEKVIDNWIRELEREDTRLGPRPWRLMEN